MNAPAADARLDVVLASSSQYRAQQLKRLGLPFAAQSPQVDEALKPGEAPRARAARLAKAKAEAVAATLRRPSVVIGSDQVAAMGNDVLSKPGQRERALEQLKRCGGKTVSFFTALYVVKEDLSQSHAHVDVTTVTLRALDEAALARYVDADLPFDCAGSFKIEALGIALIARYDSEDPTALVGLPLMSLCDGLNKLGVPVP